MQASKGEKQPVVQFSCKTHDRINDQSSSGVVVALTS